MDDPIGKGAMTYRLLTRRSECEAVVALEREIWGPKYDEAVPVALLLVTQARGGILLGAFDDGDRMIGFVYSLGATKDGRPTQWSYKLGVVEQFRNHGVGEQLKLKQRHRALEMGLDLIEWTFDPLIAANAHLNLTKLGAVVREYCQDLYGRSLAPVAHRNIPSDRFLAAWHIRDGSVTGRAQSSPASAARPAHHEIPDSDDLRVVNHMHTRGAWLECAGTSLDLSAERLAVEIPLGFGEMVKSAPDVALAWRLALRGIFGAYFARGYEAVEFWFDRSRQRGVYLLVKPEAVIIEEAHLPAMGAWARNR